MKKLSLLFLSLVITLLPILNVNAAGYELLIRDESNNYGVNKKWKITSDNLENVLATPYVDASLKIYDYANIISPQIEESLKTKMI